MDNLQKIIGKNVARYRKKHGLTQQDLAFEVGIELGSISRIEQGRLSPRTKTLQKIADVLKVQPYQLLIPSKSKKSK
jgi:transcriptional regulator with XRE-family HTH domain